MSTVLEKAVLLDETGQLIVDKLDDIKEAIGGSGEFTPIQIVVTTPPAKTNYLVGEQLDLSGIIIKLEASNGSLIDVTSQCTFVPVNGAILTANDTSVIVTYHWYKDNVDFTITQALSIKTFTSIEVTNAPIKTEYAIGDTLDLTGIEVTAHFDDNTSQDVTSLCSFSPADGDVLSSSDTEVTISCTLSGITKTTTQEISVFSIYGIEFDNTAYQCTRTDSAANFTDPVPYYKNVTSGYGSPFDNIMPWSGMQKYTDPNTSNVFVSIPKFYYKWSKSGSSIKLQISADPVDGFQVSPAHMDRGDGQGERDVVYISRYTCNSSGQSKSGQTPYRNGTYNTFKTQIHNAASDQWMIDMPMVMTLFMLMLVEFASFNFISLGTWTSYTEENTPTGKTDSMPYHTGSPENGPNSFGAYQYRYIENLFNMETCILNISWYNELVRIGIDPSSSDYVELDLGVPNVGSNPQVIIAWDLCDTEGYEFLLKSKYRTTSYSSDNGHLYGPFRTMQNAILTLQWSTGYNTKCFLGYYFYRSTSDAYMSTRIMKLPNNA